MRKFISIISVITLVILLNACEERFMNANVSSTSLSDADISADFGFGTRFASLLRNLTSGQYAEDIGVDAYVRHVGHPTAWESNKNSITYFMVASWNTSRWNDCYNNVMGPARQIKVLAATQPGLELFSAWADLLQVFALSRTTTYYGPLIYSEYGENLEQFEYDTEAELYNQFFEKLDEVQAVFTTFAADAGKKGQLTRFDATYSGDLAKWLKMINSLRLRLAIRIVKANPKLAETQGEKAMNDPVGLILANEENFKHSLYGSTHLIHTMSNSWNDTRMSAAMEEVLVGYKDPRAHVLFQPADASVLPAGRDPEWPYKGIASASYVTIKDERTPCSRVSENFAQPYNERLLLDAAEVNFALAEARLRGWTGTQTNGSVQFYYEEGVKRSWEYWQSNQRVGHRMIADYSVGAYLADDTSMPLEEYVDPKGVSDNSYKSRMIDPEAYTIKWKDGINKEKQLERIMTQKWIAAYQNANEIWNDHRRTGYPKLHFNPKNDSSPQHGTIEKNDFIKRMLFASRDIEVNPAHVAGIPAQKLGGPDLISTPLWIHTPWVDHNNPDNSLQ